MYGSAYYMAAGFAVPLCAAMFLRTKDALATLIGYVFCSVAIGTSIELGYWQPPYALDYKFQLVINGLLIIIAMSLTTIWRERVLKLAKHQEKRQKERLEAVFRNGYGLMFEANAAGIITFAAGQMIDELGYSSEELVGSPLSAGNISYQMMQFLGGMDAVGPVLVGLDRPINALPRNCDLQTVVSMTAITAVMAKRLHG